MPKDFGSLFSRIKGEKCHFWANLVEFRVQKGHLLFVPQWYSDYSRHYTVKLAKMICTLESVYNGHRRDCLKVTAIHKLDIMQ